MPVEHEESQPVKQAGDTAQPGSQPVDTVDQVDGIDDEDHDQNGQGPECRAGCRYIFHRR